MNSEDEFSTIIRPPKRFLLAVSFSIFFVCAGISTLILYFHNADIQARNQNGIRANEYITSLYLEAEKVSNNIKLFNDFTCNEDNIRKLKQLVAISPHIRSVNIYGKGMKGCSSLDGYFIKHYVLSGIQKIPFYTVMRKEDGYIFFMVYFSTSSDKIIGVAINGFFVREALSFISPEAVFYPTQDFITIKPEGYTLKNERFPYVIVLKEKDRILSHMSDTYLIITYLVAICILIGVLIYFCLGFFNSPFYALKYYIRNNRIYPLYQPIVNLRNGSVVGLEVLMRCLNPEGRELSPSQFIPPAEKYSLIKDMTISMLKKVQDDITLLPNKPIYLSINITPGMIECQETFTKLLKFSAFAQDHGLKILIEITEQNSFDLTATFSERLTHLRQSEVLIAIDDFGSGYSNLSSITKLNPDYLKIDKDFTSYILEGGIKKVLLDNIIHLSTKTSLPVIAEGIETSAQLHYLHKRGIWLFQGYIFSRPCDAISASSFITSFKTEVFK